MINAFFWYHMQIKIDITLIEQYWVKILSEFEC